MDIWGGLRTRSLGVAPGGLRKKEGERVVVTANETNDERERNRKRKGTTVTSHHIFIHF